MQFLKYICCVICPISCAHTSKNYIYTKKNKDLPKPRRYAYYIYVIYLSFANCEHKRFFFLVEKSKLAMNLKVFELFYVYLYLTLKCEKWMLQSAESMRAHIFHEKKNTFNHHTILMDFKTYLSFHSMLVILKVSIFY